MLAKRSRSDLGEDGDDFLGVAGEYGVASLLLDGCALPLVLQGKRFNASLKHSHKHLDNEMGTVPQLLRLSRAARNGKFGIVLERGEFNGNYCKMFSHRANSDTGRVQQNIFTKGKFNKMNIPARTLSTATLMRRTSWAWMAWVRLRMCFCEDFSMSSASSVSAAATCKGVDPRCTDDQDTSSLLRPTALAPWCDVNRIRMERTRRDTCSFAFWRH